MFSLVWTSVFFFLVAEIATLMLLLIPLPQFISKNLIKAIRKIASNKTLFIILIVLLSLACVESVRTQLSAAKKLKATGTATENINTIMAHTMEKFRSQRNTYLSGYSLFLLFAIWRVAAILDQVENKKNEHDEQEQTKEEQKEIAVKEPPSQPKEEPEHPKED